MNSSIRGSTTLLIYCVPAQRPRCYRFDVNKFTLNTSACARLGWHPRWRKRLLHLSRLHLNSIHSLVSRDFLGTNTRSLCTTRSTTLCNSTSPYRLGGTTLVYRNSNKRFCTIFIDICYKLVITRRGNTGRSKGNYILIHLWSTFSRTTQGWCTKILILVGHLRLVYALVICKICRTVLPYF